jgi:hypothetical protein
VFDVPWHLFLGTNPELPRKIAAMGFLTTSAFWWDTCSTTATESEIKDFLEELDIFRRNSEVDTFHHMLLETEPQIELQTPPDVLDAIMGIRYYYLRNQALFRYYHKVADSLGNSEDFSEINAITGQCFEAAWRSFTIFDQVTETVKWRAPHLACLLYRYEITTIAIGRELSGAALNLSRQFEMIVSVVSVDVKWERFDDARQWKVDRLRQIASYLRRYEQYSPLLSIDANVLEFMEMDLCRFS